jgi:hypothetical protein
VIGLVFTLAQLPVSIAGFPGTVKDSLDVIERLVPSSHADEFTVSRIGSFRFEQDASLQAATKAFGPPDSRRRGSQGINCDLRWDARGLELAFVSSIGKACAPSYGFFCSATITGDAWKTDRGLRIGDSIERLRSLYPAAAKLSAGFMQTWRLEEGTTPCEGGSGIEAATIGNSVNSFQVSYGAIGE